MFRLRQTVALAAMAMLAGAQAWAAEAKSRRIPAFPGAEGFGAHTPGGRGGRIIDDCLRDRASSGAIFSRGGAC